METLYVWKGRKHMLKAIEYSTMYQKIITKLYVFTREKIRKVGESLVGTRAEPANSPVQFLFIYFYFLFQPYNYSIFKI